MWGVPATEGTVPSSSSTRTPHADEVSRVSKTYESLVKQKEDALDSYTKLCESTGTNMRKEYSFFSATSQNHCQCYKIYNESIDPAIDKFRWKGNRLSDNPSNNALAQRNFAIRRQLGIIESASTILRKEGSRASKDA
ncbi:hypothetical protein L486_04509 [Kwoniella mangroviensis CBS 10435]|uniref:Uncharacterized protein n=1 Tax=Kwoniella mangroviensis CBS 10435 TaxID=1331196 RepID=A0A1B9ISG9_9TREE|nr:hypothetical protein L486_04509 [Kwoniella mangroviensis CBS 10435]